MDIIASLFTATVNYCHENQTDAIPAFNIIGLTPLSDGRGVRQWALWFRYAVKGLSPAI